MAISFPTQAQLPPGPLRDLTAALHELYDDAGRPGTLRLARLIKEDDLLPATVSHETISQTLRAVTFPRWEKLEPVVRKLCALAVSRPDPEAQAKRFLGLWLKAADQREGKPFVIGGKAVLMAMSGPLVAGPGTVECSACGNGAGWMVIHTLAEVYLICPNGHIVTDDRIDPLTMLPLMTQEGFQPRRFDTIHDAARANGFGSDQFFESIRTEHR